jgi:hypothetical protein
MSADRPSSTPQSNDGASGHVKDEDLERVLKTVPQGAFALAGATVSILVLAYLALYFLVFLPRGPIE